MDIIQLTPNQFNTTLPSSGIFLSGHLDNSLLGQQNITTSVSANPTQISNIPVAAFQSLTPQGSIFYSGVTGNQTLLFSDFAYNGSSNFNSNNANSLTGQPDNYITFLGTSQADSLFLRADANNSLEFSINGTDFSESGFKLSKDTNITVRLGSGNDTLNIDSSLANALKNTGANFVFDGGEGDNTLFGPNIDTKWNITGENSGNVADVKFQNVENLKAAANNYATFDFSANGSLSGIADGGDGNLGTLIYDGQYSITQSTAFSPHAGTIDFYNHQSVLEKTIQYAGLAPIFDNSVTANRVFTATSADDQILVTKSATGQTSIFSNNGTFESFTFLNPSNSLTIKGLGGNDTITLNSLDPNFTKSLIIDGNDGNDSVIFANNLTLNGSNLTVDAENISVNNGITIDTTGLSGLDGNIAFTAADTESGLTASGQVQINLSGATIKAGNINISATSTVSGSLTSLPIAFVNLTSTANIAVINSRIESSGDVTLSSSSIVTGTAQAQGLSSYINTAVDAAAATSIIDSSAITYISGTSSFNVQRNLALIATNNINSTTSGDASPAQGGAGIAISKITNTTQAYIDGSSSQ